MCIHLIFINALRWIEIYWHLPIEFFFLGGEALISSRKIVYFSTSVYLDFVVITRLMQYGRFPHVFGPCLGIRISCAMESNNLETSPSLFAFEKLDFSLPFLTHLPISNSISLSWWDTFQLLWMIMKILKRKKNVKKSQALKNHNCEDQ